MPNPGVRTAAAQSTRQVYDRVTIILHWLTAVLVVSLFASAETGGGYLEEQHCAGNCKRCIFRSGFRSPRL